MENVRCKSVFHKLRAKYELDEESCNGLSGLPWGYDSEGRSVTTEILNVQNNFVLISDIILVL